MKKFFLGLFIIILVALAVTFGVLYYNEAKAHNEDISKWAEIVYEKNARIDELETELAKSNISEIVFEKQEDTEYTEIYSSENGNIYSIGGNVKIVVNENEYILEEVLEETINYEDFTKKMQEDEDANISKRIYNKEGIEEGSIVFEYADFIIVKTYDSETEKYDGYLIGTEEDILEFYKNA